MKSILKLTIFAFIAITSLSCNSQQQSKKSDDSGKITLLSPSEFKEKSVNQPIVDIRTPMEFQQGYIDGAKNINYFDSNFLKEMASYDKTKPLFLYCKSGNRTSMAAAKLKAAGFEQLFELQGGIINWVRNNEPIKN